VSRLRDALTTGVFALLGGAALLLCWAQDRFAKWMTKRRSSRWYILMEQADKAPPFEPPAGPRKPEPAVFRYEHDASSTTVLVNGEIDNWPRKPEPDVLRYEQDASSTTVLVNGEIGNWRGR
jgi:hypothetical protein